MIAALLTLGFLAAAFFAVATIGASLAKGWASAAALRRDLATCGHERMLTLRSLSTTAGQPVGRAVIPERGSRRVARQTSLPVRRPQRVAA